MFRTKAEVDLHVKDLLSKLHSEPERVNKCFVIGKQYAGIREFGEATSYLEKYLRSNPPNKVETLKILGDILLEQKKLDDAFVKYRNAVDSCTNPVHKEALNRLVDLLKQGYGPDDPMERQKYFDLQASLPPTTYGHGSRLQTAGAHTNNARSMITMRNSPLPPSNSSSPFVGGGKGASNLNTSISNGKSPGIRATSTPKKLGNLSAFQELVQNNVMHTISPERIHANVLTLERRVESLFDKFEESAESLSISMAGLGDKMTRLDINIEEVKEMTKDVKDNFAIQQQLQQPMKAIMTPPIPMIPPPPPPQPIVIQAPACCSTSSNNNDREFQRLEKKLDDLTYIVKTTKDKLDSLPDQIIKEVSGLLKNIRISQEREQQAQVYAYPPARTPESSSFMTTQLFQQSYQEKPAEQPVETYKTPTKTETAIFKPPILSTPPSKPILATPKSIQETQQSVQSVPTTEQVDSSASKSGFGFGASAATTSPIVKSLLSTPTGEFKTSTATTADSFNTPASTGGGLFSGFSFGNSLSQTTLGFGDLAKSGSIFGGNKPSSETTTPTPAAVFGTPPAPRQRSTSQGSEGGEDDFVPTAEFAPVIPLPPLVEVKAGDEDEDLVLEVRAKVYRFDRETKEWKERGVGNLKLLQHKEDPGRVRVLMWREKVLKLAINHRLNSDIKPVYYQNNKKTLSWSAVDHAEEEPRPELFTVRFGSEDKAAEFKAKMEELIQTATSNVTPVKVKTENPKQTTETPQKEQTQKTSTLPPLSELFKKEEDSWDCGTCYVNNKKGTVKCVSCSTPKPGHENDQDQNVPSVVTEESSSTAPKFTFGFATMTPPNLKPTPPVVSLESKTPTTTTATDSSITSTTPATGTGLFSGFSFSSALGQTSLGFGDLAKSGSIFGVNKSSESNPLGTTTTAPAPVFGTPPAPRQRSTSQGSEGGEDDFVPTAEFAPVIPLPPLVEVKAGDEDEDLVLEVRAKVYRFDRDTKEWKERGVGNLKLLQHKEDPGRVRVLMWREKVLKLAINHRLNSDIKPVYYQNNKRTLSWSAVDHAEEEPRPELFTVRFGSEDKAEEFKAKMEELIETSSSSVSPVKVKTENPTLAIETPEKDQTQKTGSLPPLSELFKKEEDSWDCGTCYVNNKKGTIKCVSCATPKPGHENDQELNVTEDLSSTAPKFTFGFGATTPPNLKSAPTVSFDSKTPTTAAADSSTTSTTPATGTGLFSSFSFGSALGQTPLGFGDLAKSGSIFMGNKQSSETNMFGTAPVPVFGSPAPRQRSASQGSEGEDDFVPTAEFAPVIPLPPLVEVKAGDEDEDVVLEVRAKVYRFNRDTKEWKERGVGNLKLLQHKEDPGRVRVLMWREKVLKLAINHRLNSDIKPTFYLNNPKVLSWSAVDHAEEEPRPELFTVRFGSEEQAAEFKVKMDELIEAATTGGTPVKVEISKSIFSTPPNADSKDASQKPLSELFKKEEDSWDCGTCYVNNKKDTTKCISCATPKPGHENDPNQSFQSFASSDANSSFQKFSFGFGATTPPTFKSATADSKPTNVMIPEPWAEFDRTEFDELASCFK